MLFWTSIEIDLQDLPKMLLQFINFIYKNTVPLQPDLGQKWVRQNILFLF